MPDNLFQRGKSVAINKVCKNISFRSGPLRLWDTLGIATRFAIHPVPAISLKRQVLWKLVIEWYFLCSTEAHMKKHLLGIGLVLSLAYGVVPG